MQAAAKAAVSELAKGLSTGLVVYARCHCPDCDPHLHCAACAASPAPGTAPELAAPTFVSEFIELAKFLAVVGHSVAAGFVAGWNHRGACFVAASPAPSVTAPVVEIGSRPWRAAPKLALDGSGSGRRGPAEGPAESSAQ